MNSHSTEISVTARYGEIPSLLAELAHRAAALGVAAADIGRLQLVIEELFTNTIRHGYGGDSNQPVRVSLSRKQGILLLIYSDQAPPFDLTADLPQEAPEIGGLGIPLIRGMSKSLRYQRRNGLNVTELDF